MFFLDRKIAIHHRVLDKPPRASSFASNLKRFLGTPLPFSGSLFILLFVYYLLSFRKSLKLFPVCCRMRACVCFCLTISIRLVVAVESNVVQAFIGYKFFTFSIRHSLSLSRNSQREFLSIRESLCERPLKESRRFNSMDCEATKHSDQLISDVGMLICVRRQTHRVLEF